MTASADSRRVGRHRRSPQAPRSRRLNLSLELVIAAAITSALVLVVHIWGPRLAHDLRERLLTFAPVRALEVAAGLVEALVILRVAAAIPRARTVVARGRDVSLRLLAVLGRVPPVVALTVIVAVAASFRVLLTRAETIPHVFGDELLYTDLAKSIGLHGRPLVRGTADIGHSVLYPLVLSPAYRLSADGAAAYVAVKTLNAIVVSLAAVPTYFLARRLISRGWSLGIAALVVIEPWTAYAAFTMTESLFLPAFTAFALILVRMLEQPKTSRQLWVLVGLALLIGIRPQALVFAGSIVAAVAIKGLLGHGIRDACRQHVIVLAGFGAAIGGVLIAAAFGVAIPAGSARQLLTTQYSPLGLLKWTAWSLAIYELPLGVITFAAFPLALRRLLRRSVPEPERSVATAAVTLVGGILVSVAVLSASRRYGLGILHERNMFYATPLVLVCVAHWLTHGLERPKVLAAGAAAAVCILPATLPNHLVAITNNVDSPTSGWLQQLKGQAPDTPLKVWTITIGAAGAIGLLLIRRPVTPVLSTALAFLAVGSPLDYSGPFTPRQDHGLAWVDHDLPVGATATLIHVGLSNPSAPCAGPADSEQEQLVTWTEFFNTRVDRVMHIFEPAPGLLPSEQLTEAPGGVIVAGGKPFSARYVVLDSRQPVNGRRLARFDLAKLNSPLQSGSSLSLWKTRSPLRFAPPATPLPPRPDGGSC